MKLKVDVPVLAHIESWLLQQSHRNQTKSSDTAFQEAGSKHSVEKFKYFYVLFKKQANEASEQAPSCYEDIYRSIA